MEKLGVIDTENRKYLKAKLKHENSQPGSVTTRFILIGMISLNICKACPRPFSRSVLLGLLFN